jgi:hypothetical protein
MNQWLRLGVPALVVFGLGYVVRAADEREYASERLHLFLVLGALVVVIIGVVIWLGENDNPRR